MIATTGNTKVIGREEVVDTKVRKTGRFLFFKTEWWETVATKHFGNDLHILSNRPIRDVYLNGERIHTSQNVSLPKYEKPT